MSTTPSPLDFPTAASMEVAMDAYDDDPSLSASLEEFAAPTIRSPVPDMPSQHSGFRSEYSDDGRASSPQERWSPPGLRQPSDSLNGSHWYRHTPYDRLYMRPTLQPHSAPASREASPQYEDAPEVPPPPLPQKSIELPDVALAASVPLPPGTDSPLKGRSVSPEPRADEPHSNCRLFQCIKNAR